MAYLILGSYDFAPQNLTLGDASEQVVSSGIELAESMPADDVAAECKRPSIEGAIDVYSFFIVVSLGPDKSLKELR